MTLPYSYGICSGCKVKTWLKDGRCANCNKNEPPDIIKEIFGCFDKKTNVSKEKQ